MSIKNNLIKKIKIKYDNETYSDYIPIGAESRNVSMDNNQSVQEVIGNLDAIKDGSITEQLALLNKEKETNNFDNTLVCNIAYRNCSEYVQGDTDETSPVEGYLQGFTTTPTTYLLAYQMGGSYENKSNMVYLREVSKSNGTILRTAYLELFHANSLAFNEKTKEIYVAACSYRDDNYTLRNKNDILVVDYDTFTIKDIIAPPSEITAKNRVRSVSYDNKNKVLAFADTKDVWIMKSWGTIDKHIVLDLSYTAPNTNPLYNSGTNQTIVVFDNKIYSSRYSENGICVFNMEGKLIKNYYNLDVDIPVRMGELQGIALEDNGVLYIGSEQFASLDSSRGKFYDSTIFKTNLNYGGYKNYYWGANQDSSAGFYVDKSTTNMYQAGTERAPFKHIQQAIMACDMAERKNRAMIYLRNNQTYGMLVYKGEKPLLISGGQSSIKTMWIQQANIIFSNVIFDLTKNLNQYSEANPCNIYINDRSIITFDGCKFINSDVNNFRENAILVDKTDVYMTGCTFENFTNMIRMIDLCNLYCQSSFTTNNCLYYWYINWNCSINFRSNTILRKLNPQSKSIPYLYWDTQYIDFTYEDNTLTFDNPVLDDERVFDITLKPTLDGVQYIDFVPIMGFTTYHSLSFINSQKTYKYDVYIDISHPSTGTYNFSYSALKTSISTGAVTDITNSSSFVITGMKRR